MGEPKTLMFPTDDKDLLQEFALSLLAGRIATERGITYEQAVAVIGEWAARELVGMRREAEES